LSPIPVGLARIALLAIAKKDVLISDKRMVVFE